MDWTDWIEQLNEHDRLNGTHWFWMTLTPTTTVYNDVVPWTERNLDDARMSDADYVAKTTPVTARLVRDALYDTLDQIDPLFNRNHPQRTAAHARLAVILVPALKVRDGGRGRLIRVIHYHGWIVLPKLVRTTTTDPRTYETKSLIVRHDETPTKLYTPEPVALFASRLMDACGSNLNVTSPDSDELLRTHALYATRGMTHDTDGIASRISHETNYPTSTIVLPRWYWRPRLERIVSVA